MYKWDIGIASKHHDYINLAYQTGSDNYGFDVDPRDFSGINIMDGKPHTVWAWASSVPGNTTTVLYEFASFTIPACTAPTPQPAGYQPNNDATFDDEENPTRVNLDFGAFVQQGSAFNTTVTPVYYVKRGNVRFPGSINPADFSGGAPPGSQTINGDWNSPSYLINNPVSRYNLNPGDSICAALGINPSRASLNSSGQVVSVLGSISSNITNDATADAAGESCVSLANKPYIGFYGNDVKVGAGVDGTTDCTSKPNDSTIKTYSKTTPSGSIGSGGQIAAFALGTIKDFSTAKKNTATGSDELTVAQFGSFGANCTHNYWDEAPTSASSGTINSINTNGEKFRFNTAQTLNPSGVNLGINNNNKKFIYVDGNVEIKGNVVLADSGATTIKQLPSFYLVVRGDIFIHNSVTRLDGVYVAHKRSATVGGNIYTCTNGSTPYNGGASQTNDCNRQLVINGVFIGNEMHFDRTFGSLRDAVGDKPFTGTPRNCAFGSAQSTCAAEVFNFNPSLFLANSPRPENSSEESNDLVPFTTSLPPLL